MDCVNERAAWDRYMSIRQPAHGDFLPKYRDKPRHAWLSAWEVYAAIVASAEAQYVRERAECLCRSCCIATMQTEEGKALVMARGGLPDV